MNAEVNYPLLISLIRQARDLTQEQLARELGVTFGTVNGWENGKHQPSPLAARAILDLAKEAGIGAAESSGASPRTARSPANPRGSDSNSGTRKGKPPTKGKVR